MQDQKWPDQIRSIHAGRKFHYYTIFSIFHVGFYTCQLELDDSWVLYFTAGQYIFFETGNMRKDAESMECVSD